MTKDNAVCIAVMIVTAISFTKNPTKKVNLVAKQIKQKLTAMYKIDEYPQKTMFGYKVTPVLSQHYQDLQTKVSDAWDKSRREHIPKDGKLNSSMGELLTGLFNALSRSEYKELFIKESTLVGAVNSYSGSSNHSEDVDADNNSRLLVKGFLEGIGVTKDTRLSRMRITIANNIIIEKG